MEQNQIGPSLAQNTLDQIPSPAPNARRITALVKQRGKVVGYQLSDHTTLGKQQAVELARQGGIAGVINATGAITWIVAPVSATALYGWMPLSPFLLALSLVALSCACAWWLLHRADLEARARD